MLEPDGDRPIFEDNLVGTAFGFAKLLRFQRPGDINGAGFRPEMKTNRGGVEHFDQYGRKQVLAGVLLHVIDAAAPIDAAVHFDVNQRIAQNMRDTIPLVNYFDDLRSTELSGIERLAAGSRIKRCAIEIDALPVRTHVDHASPEFSEIAVLIIEAVCHCTASCTDVLSTLSTSNS